MTSVYFVVRTFKISSLSNFQVNNTVLLAVVTTLHIRSPVGWAPRSRGNTGWAPCSGRVADYVLLLGEASSSPNWALQSPPAWWGCRLCSLAGWWLYSTIGQGCRLCCTIAPGPVGPQTVLPGDGAASYTLHLGGTTGCG